MKLIGGEWKWNEVVEIELDNGKVVKRKVKYETLEGMYVVIDKEKIGKATLTK